ncbi:MAG: helix-turn-helix domain-containing protein [Bacteroidota bacterium]|jgi:transcriptional regulator with XRE-family HTH domain
MHIGLQIKFARMRKRLTQQDLAERINKTRPLISNIEQTGKVNYYTLVKICEVLEVDIDSLHQMVEEPDSYYPSADSKNKNQRLQQLERQIEQLNMLVDSQKDLIVALKEKVELLSKK